MGNSALSGIVSVRPSCAGAGVDICAGNEACRGPLASVTLRARLRQSGGQLPNRWNAGVVTVVQDTCVDGMQSMYCLVYAVCLWSCVRAVDRRRRRVYEGTTGAPRWEWISMYKGRASAKLCRQGWAGATADTEGATWTPTPGHLPLHFTLALNRRSQALPETPRHCTSWLARHGLPLFHETLHSTAIDRERRRLALLSCVLLSCTAPSAAITLMRPGQHISFLLRSHEPSRRLQRPLCHYAQYALAESISAHAWELGLLPQDGVVQGRSLARMAHDCYLDRARKVSLPESPAKEDDSLLSARRCSLCTSRQRLTIHFKMALCNTPTRRAA